MTLHVTNGDATVGTLRGSGLANAILPSDGRATAVANGVRPAR